MLMIDYSIWSLIFSNLIIVALVITQKLTMVEVLWIYWAQSVAIGLINVVRILSLKDFSTEGFKINQREVEPTGGTKIYTAIFFAIHYGIFHFVYAFFLLIFSSIPESATALTWGGKGISKLYIISIIIVFFLNHLYSYIYNRPRDVKKQNIGRVMFFPYIRILPMHLIIIFGFALSFYGKYWVLLLFVLLKMIADIVMHKVEHS